MKKLEQKFIHICEHATISQNGSPSIINLIDTFLVNQPRPDVKSLIPHFVVVSSFSGEPGNYKLNFTIKDPNGEKKSEVDIVLTIDPGKDNGGNLLNINLFQYDKLGDYQIEYSDEEGNVVGEASFSMRDK